MVKIDMKRKMKYYFSLTMVLIGIALVAWIGIKVWKFEDINKRPSDKNVQDEPTPKS